MAECDDVGGVLKGGWTHGSGSGCEGKAGWELFCRALSASLMDCAVKTKGSDSLDSDDHVAGSAGRPFEIAIDKASCPGQIVADATVESEVVNSLLAWPVSW